MLVTCLILTHGAPLTIVVPTVHLKADSQNPAVSAPRPPTSAAAGPAAWGLGRPNKTRQALVEGLRQARALFLERCCARQVEDSPQPMVAVPIPVSNLLFCIIVRRSFPFVQITCRIVGVELPPVDGVIVSMAVVVVKVVVLVLVVALVLVLAVIVVVNAAAGVTEGSVPAAAAEASGAPLPVWPRHLSAAATREEATAGVDWPSPTSLAGAG
eukprot:gene15464-biopygen13513